jgi:hypothetical protein
MYRTRERKRNIEFCSGNLKGRDTWGNADVDEKDNIKVYGKRIGLGREFYRSEEA